MSHKLLHEYENHFMIQHPDGSTFPVAKKGLGSSAIEKIRNYGRVVKLNQGGDVPEVNSNSIDPKVDFEKNLLPSLQNNQTPANPSFDSSAFAKSSPPLGETQASGAPIPSPAPTPAPPAMDSAPVSAPPVATAPVATKSNVQTASYSPDQNSEPTGSVETGIKSGPLTSPNDPLNAFPGYKESMAGIQGNADIISKAGKKAASVQQNLIDQEKKIHKESKTQLDGINSKITEVQNNVLNGKIDPNRVWSNMGTGNKVMAAIAIALGGASAGLTGKSNPALDVINNAIDKDIEAQKSDLGRQNNLLSSYMSQYHNLAMAENAAKLHLATVASAQMQKIAAQTGSQNAINQANMQAGQMRAQYAPIMQRQAIMSSLMSQKGNLQPEIAAKAVQYVVPEKQQDQAYKEIDRVTAATKARDAINTYFGSSNDQNSLISRVTQHGGFEPADLKALEANVMPVIKDLEGRVNEREMEVLKGLYPSMGDKPATIQTKLRGLNSFINAKSQSSLLEANNIFLNKGRYTEQGKNKFSEGAPQ